MQVPFQDLFNNNQHFLPPNQIQWQPKFFPQNLQHLKPSPAHWRQHQEFSNEFWCETCDRGFRTTDILEKHKQQHQKCNIDGCQFIAHPKVITKHIQMQHASGLYKKIAKLQDPEEIKKWREERKRKYPSKENVEKAAAAVKEKIDRGEKMGLKYGGRHEKNPRPGGPGKRIPYNNKKIHTSRLSQNFTSNSKRRKIISKKFDQKLPSVEDTRKLKPFGGIQDLTIDVDEQQDELDIGFTIEDEDDLSEASVQVYNTSGSVCHALSSLLCNYGSSDEECEKNQTTIKTQKTEELVTQLIGNTSKNLIAQSKNDIDDDSGPEEVKVTKTIVNENNITESNTRINIKKPKVDVPKKPIFRKPKPKMPPTLLRKLLFKEMRQERNIILQCIRHVVKNNFFDKTV